MRQSAIKIYQSLLDQTGAALIARDADAFLRHIFLPHTIATETSRVVVETRAQALVHFNGFSNALAAQGVDAYTRVAQEAWFEGDTRLLGRHKSYMTSAGKLVVPQFSNEMALDLRDGIWGFTTSRHLTRYVAWPDILPRRSEGSDAN